MHARTHSCTQAGLLQTAQADNHTPTHLLVGLVLLLVLHIRLLREAAEGSGSGSCVMNLAIEYGLQGSEAGQGSRHQGRGSTRVAA